MCPNERQDRYMIRNGPEVFLFSYRQYGNDFPVSALPLVSHNSVCSGEQGIISSESDVNAGMDPCASLTIEDVACFNELAVRTLCAETLGFGITAVLCGADTFLMSEELKI